MNHKVLILCVAFGFMFCALTVSAEESTTEVEQNASVNDFIQKYFHNHVEIGTRSTGYTFTDDTQGQPFQGSFLGSLNEVHEHQNFAPVKAFIQYKFNPYVGVGAAYDQFKAVTGMSPRGEAGGDGSFDLKGGYFYLLGSYPNESRFTPFAEVGFVSYGADFDAKAWWSDNGRRVMNPDNAVGTVFAIGCDIQVYKQWSVDVYLRHVDVDLDVDYIYLGYRHTSGTFTLSHNEYGIGVKYRF